MLCYEALTLMHECGLAEGLREQLTGPVGPTPESFAVLGPNPATTARHQQFFMATNLGYAQISKTALLSQNLRDSRASFVVSTKQAVLMFCET